MARQFFEGQQRPGGHALSAPHHFHPSELARMAEINGHPAEFNDAWTRERSHQHILLNNITQSSWAAEFSGPQQHSSIGPSMQHSITHMSENCKLPFIMA
jgi:peroxin-5